MAYTTLNKMVTVFINNICSLINNFILWRRIYDKMVVEHPFLVQYSRIRILSKPGYRWFFVKNPEFLLP